MKGLREFVVLILLIVSCAFFMYAWIFNWSDNQMIGWGVIFILMTMRMIADEKKVE